MAFTSGPLYLNVFDFGAVGDGVTDDSGAIQSAIDAAITIRSSGAQNAVVVFFPSAPYFCNNVLSIQVPPSSSPTDVPIVLSGASRGPYLLNPNSGGRFDPTLGSNKFDIPILLVVPSGNNLSSPFITIGSIMQGPGQIPHNITIEDLHFRYLANDNPDHPPDISFPPTINVFGQDIRIRRCSTDNAFQFIMAGIDSVTSTPKGVQNPGGLICEDLYVGAFQLGIAVDDAQGVALIRDVHITPPFVNPIIGSFPTNASGLFARQNLNGIWFFRSDLAMVKDCSVFGANIGLLSTTSLVPAPNTPIPPNSYGFATNFRASECVMGFNIKDSQDKGWTFTNYIATGGQLTVGGTTVSSQWAGFAGGANNPGLIRAQVLGGSISGTWQGSQRLQPYSAISSSSFTGPFGQGVDGIMKAFWVDGYD